MPANKPWRCLHKLPSHKNRHLVRIHLSRLRQVVLTRSRFQPHRCAPPDATARSLIDSRVAWPVH